MPVHDGVPQIVDLAFVCERRTASWRVDLTADAWTGGATLFWTSDGGWRERHESFRSVRAAVDGTSDELRLDLRIVDDFRPAGTGGVTAFTCNVPMSGLVWVLDLEGAPVDCVWFGDGTEPLRNGVDVPECEREWVLGEEA